MFSRMARSRLATVLPVLPWALSLLTSCSGDGGSVGPCSPGPDPTLTIGVGVGGFTPIEDGEFPLVHGPQGGFHLEIGLSATHLDADELMTGHFEGVIDGTTYASTDPWLEFRCDETTNTQVSWGTRLIYDSTPEFLDGKLTTVSIEVTDFEGTTLSVIEDFTIRDDP